MINGWTYLDSKEIKGRRYSEIVKTLLTPEGKQVEYTHLTFSDGVMICPLDEDGQVYLTKQLRIPIQQEILEFPGGGIGDGETPIDAAKKELREEIGLTASNWYYLGHVFTSPGNLDARTHLYLATNVTQGQTDLGFLEQIHLEKRAIKDLDFVCSMSNSLPLKVNKYIQRL